MDIKGLISELDLFIEIEDLKEMGLIEEEIFGYIDMYIESWIGKAQVEEWI